MKTSKLAQAYVGWIPREARRCASICMILFATAKDGLSPGKKETLLTFVPNIILDYHHY